SPAEWPDGLRRHRQLAALIVEMRDREGMRLPERPQLDVHELPVRGTQAASARAEDDAPRPPRDVDDVRDLERPLPDAGRGQEAPHDDARGADADDDPEPPERSVGERRTAEAVNERQRQRDVRDQVQPAPASKAEALVPDETAHPDGRQQREG